MPNFDDPNISPDCLRCREACIAKSKEGIFDINCSGIFPADYKLELAAGRPLTDSERQAALALLDPVGWAHEVLDWTPRISGDDIPYQALMLRCGAKRTVSRCGRRIGKSDVMAIDMLYNSTTKALEKVLVVCPQKSHAQVVYDRLLELIDRSPDLKASLKRAIKTPYAEIEFHNGSIIKLFTSGAKSGSEGASVRGQSATRIYLDEADYLEDADHNAIGAILYSSPETILWASSTPTGRRQRFYDQCHDSRYREFHYPTSVLPFWDDQMEKDIRLDCGTESGYQHEALAEFGEEVEGVYQNKYVDRSLIDYEYEDQSKTEGWVYTMGVDWNDTQIGTQISIVGFNPASGKYRVVSKHCVDKIGWTQLAAINKIREVNEYWKCAHIYCDAGFGTTQIEILQQYGETSLAEKGPGHPDSMLRYVKGINAGGNLETKNIRTGVTETKPAKPYMIENSVRYFEHDLIEVAKYDTELENELLGYVVARRTQSGAPVYEQGNRKVGDHELDALVLALLAFTMEFTEFGQILTRSYVSFGGAFGDRQTVKMPPAPGTVELVIEHQSDKKRTQEKRDANLPEDRFNIGSDRILSRGLPGVTSRYNKDTARKPRSRVKRMAQVRPSRTNI